jgi:hypothetical protein
MNRLVFCSLRHTRWAVLFLPLFFTGCFNSPSATDQPANGSKTGIAALSRFFAFSRSVPDSSSDAMVDAEAAMLVPEDTASLYYGTEDISDIGIAAPVSISSTRSPIAGTSGASYLYSPASEAAGKRGWSPNLGTEARLVFNTSFSKLISTVFKPTWSNESSLGVKDDLLNPFTEARQIEASLTSSVSTSSVTSAAVETNPAPADGNSQSADAQTSAEPPDPAASEPAAASVSGLPISASFLIIGDFSGSGTISSITATRLGDTSFAFQGGELEFSLFINPSALENQRAFYVDDLNGDSIPDLLATNQMSLFGGVYFGDGNGGYNLSDKFVTGYQATIPGAGPFINGKREILAVDTYWGIVTAFRSDNNYRMIQRVPLSFVPDYLLHMVAPGTSRDYLLAAKAGGARQILGWADDGSLGSTSETLPADPLILSSQFGTNAVRVYQVGNYASVVLSSQSNSFNVANFRVSPGTFLIIGDLQRQGSADVAVANLMLFTPRTTR